jgi:hypothetical protein
MVFSNNLLMGAAGQSGGYEIDQSIRFNDDDSAYLTDTLGTATDANRWTYSVWVKRGALPGTQMGLIVTRLATNDTGFLSIQFDSDNTFFMTGWSTRWRQTSQVFRDPSAWYHIIVAVDTDQATANDRIKIYVNGAQVTDFSTTNNPSSGANLGLNQAAAHEIGRDTGGIRYFDGYMAEINFIDGQQLAPTDFGEYNDDGVWVPKAYAGTYGDNGFYLTGENSADLGADYSGNGNDFTSSGLTTSSQVLDTPTDNYCVMNENVQNRDSNQTKSDGIREANLQLYRPSSSANSFGSGTMAVYGGVGSPKLYYEVYTTSYPGGNVLQMYIEDASSSENVSSSSFGLNQRHTTSSYRVFIYPGNSETPGTWTSEFGQGVYVGLAVDFANDEISANVDGTEIFSYNATELAALTGITIDTFAGRWWRPKIQVGNDQPTTIDVNFGQNAFQNAPAGYVGWSTSAIPTPTITDGSLHFNPYLYTGNGSASTRSFTGMGFQPDFIWKKKRSGADHHWLHDAVRGATKGLNSNRTDTEATSNRLTSFDSDGFSFATSDPDTNGSGATYVAWAWKGGNGTASNGNGSIASTVSANTTAGFSTVGYTGNGTAGATVGHGLGVKPSMLICKNRDNTEQWIVYQEDQGATKYGLLNSTAAFASSSGAWNNTEPTSSVVTLGGGGFGTNVSSNDMIMYAFAEVEGFSKYGVYTGNGSTDGPFVSCGFRPAFVIAKRTNSADNWAMYDAARDPYNVAEKYLYADTTAAETTYSTAKIDFLSNGFKWRGAVNFGNASGSTYIFMAFAEHPFGGEDVAPVPAR